MSFANETFKTTFFEGKAPIIVDGDLSDWDVIGAIPVDIPIINEKFALFTFIMDILNFYSICCAW